MKNTFRMVAALALFAVTIGSASANPPSQRDLAKCDTATLQCSGLVVEAPNRYTPHTVGQPVDLHFLFGPYIVPPGQDSNRITIDLPLQTGYLIAVAPDLVDAASGRIPTQQEAHIHHAHWFRVTNDPQQEYYDNIGGQGLSWVFGTGEEKTQGRLDDRARLEPSTNNWNYGIPVDGNTPQVLIYMIHNKQSSEGHYFVVLDVTFIPGTRDQIKAATGKDIHPLFSQLWGQTKDVTDTTPNIGARWTVSHDGVGIAMGSHIHPGGKAVIVSNIGPNITDPVTGKVHPMCYTSDGKPIDPDHDGFAGVAILNSYKYDHDMNVWPYSEDYQMGATKFGWRAPLHKGDILEQQATYALTPGSTDAPYNRISRDTLFHNWYQAMSYTGIYYDREQSPGAAPTSCTEEAFAPHLLGPDTFQAQGEASSWLDSSGNVKSDLIDPNTNFNYVDEVAGSWNHFLGETTSTITPGMQSDGFTAGQIDEHARAIQGMVNHIWKVREPLCQQPGLAVPVNDPNLTTACGPTNIDTQVGPEVTEINTAGFTFAPGDLNVKVPTTDGRQVVMIPQVRQGTTLTLVNQDFIANVRHTFTSCAWPCVGTYVSNFPLPSGGPGSFDSGKLGNIDPIDGGLFNDGGDLASFLGGGQSDTVPVYHMFIDPAKFAPGKYAYFCRIHPFMRGAFEVIPA